ncbi:hypothetical protein L1049_012706 [Liquidambar formosana]|uniref:Uncharacterized protein n=1 Tax=Liquidambar formosana TaxID=63359 RepID=A0AAP0RN01_LIQFO
MGRAPCCDKANVKKGPWSPEEDSKLKDYIEKYGTGGNWIALPQKAGLKRCGKSCRLRWLNYLRPNIKHGEFSDHEDRIICSLFASIGSRWSIIAAQLPGRTDNDIKNYWNTKLKKKLMGMVASSHRKPHQTPLIPSPLHQTPSVPSPSLPSLYKDCTSYYTPTKCFPGLEPIPVSSYLLNNNATTCLATNSFLENQESLVGPMQYYHPVKDNHSNNNNILMFGNEASCCSSSDGSGTTQISYGREIKQELDMNFHSYISNGFEENQKFMLGYSSNNGAENVNNGWTDEKTNGCFGAGDPPPLEYDVEEVKQLISSTNNATGCDSFFNDENKTQEKVMYYYYY